MWNVLAWELCSPILAKVYLGWCVVNLLEWSANKLTPELPSIEVLPAPVAALTMAATTFGLLKIFIVASAAEFEESTDTPLYSGCPFAGVPEFRVYMEIRYAKSIYIRYSIFDWVKYKSYSQCV